MKKKTLSAAGLTKIVEFCKKVHAARATRNKRNNDSGDHRLTREITGKVGEACVAYLLNLWHKIDFDVYETGNVKFEADLGKHIHVKTCHIDAKGTELDSWLVDKSDDVFHNPHKNDKIYLAYANELGKCEVLGYVNAVDVYWIWKSSKTLFHKMALYIDDIKDLIHPIKN
jgi:hypothetical protein